jgi:hypothetical protein
MPQDWLPSPTLAGIESRLHTSGSSEEYGLDDLSFRTRGNSQILYRSLTLDCMLPVSERSGIGDTSAPVPKNAVDSTLPAVSRL